MLISLKTTFYLYENQDKEFEKYFTRDELHFFKYCNDVRGLVKALDMEYNALFLESSLRSMKTVLLNFRNKIVPISIAHSVNVLKESY